MPAKEIPYICECFVPYKGTFTEAEVTSKIFIPAATDKLTQPIVHIQSVKLTGSALGEQKGEELLRTLNSDDIEELQHDVLNLWVDDEDQEEEAFNDPTEEDLN